MKLVLRVLKVSTQDRVQQLFVELIPLFSLMILSGTGFNSVWWCSSSRLCSGTVPQRLVEQTFAPGVSARASSRPSGVDEGVPMVKGAPSALTG